MKEKIDNFSSQSSDYKKYRPQYPDEFYEYILGFVENKDRCLDMGCGTGQVTNVLLQHFNKVDATDISKNQLKNAPRKKNVNYHHRRAEDTGLEGSQYDFIAVAQAAHWFDIDAFNKEVNRLLKKGGICCLWGYDLIQINPSIDKHVRSFYNDTLEKYWDPEREHIDNHYDSIDLQLKEIEVEKKFEIVEHWSREQFEGFFNSWSAVQHYIDDNDKNPVNDLIKNIAPFWHRDKENRVTFPLFLKIGRK